MVNKRFGLGMLAMMLVFGFGTAGVASAVAYDLTSSGTVAQAQQFFHVTVTGRIPHASGNGWNTRSANFHIQARNVSEARGIAIGRFRSANPTATHVTAN